MINRKSLNGDKEILMKKTNIMLAALGILILLSQNAGAEVIKADGSSTVFPITEAVAEEFGKSSGGTKVMVGISGLKFSMLMPHS